MTLGCGGWGGNITSDNISPKHLLNIKRVAYELRPAIASGTQPAASSSTGAGRPVTASVRTRTGLSPDVLGGRIDEFLASRGITTPVVPPSAGPTDRPPESRPAEFVCEEDVRQAVRSGRKILLDARSIVTPSARDLGDEKRIFIESR
jgi:acetaldehyde dehydrogenase (acetylating)